MNGCSPEVPFRTGSDRTGQPAVVSVSVFLPVSSSSGGCGIRTHEEAHAP